MLCMQLPLLAQFQEAAAGLDAFSRDSAPKMAIISPELTSRSFLEDQVYFGHDTKAQ